MSDDTERNPATNVLTMLEAAAAEGSRVERAALLLLVEKWLHEARRDSEVQAYGRMAAWLRERGV